MSVAVRTALILRAAVDDAATTTSPGAGMGSGEPPGEALIFLAWGSLGLCLLVILVALGFIGDYHRQLLAVVTKAVDRGAAVSTVSEPVRDPGGSVAAQSAGPTFAITSDAEEGRASPGADVTFTAAGWPRGEDPATITWATDEGQPATGAGETFRTRAPGTGTLTVVATVADADPATASVSIAPPAPTSAATVAGIALPFAIRGWGGFVITTLGIGVVVALLFAGVVSEGAGLGILGTLLGVGAASAAGAKKDPGPAAPADGSSSTAAR